MKKIRKGILISLFACFVCTEVVMAGEMVDILQSSSAVDSVDTMRADVIQWVYKEINGKMYRRLYNYTKQEYIGDWILIG